MSKILARTWRRREHQRHVLVAVLMTLLLVAPAASATELLDPHAAESATGGVARDFLAHMTPGGAKSAAALGDAAAQLRTAASEGTLAPVLGHLRDPSGGAVFRERLPTPTSAMALPELEGLPHELAHAVRGLHAAVQVAKNTLGLIPSDELVSVVSQSESDLARWGAEHRPGTDQRRPGPPPGAPAGDAPSTALPPAIQHAVERAPDAALLISAAIDSYGGAVKAAHEDSTAGGTAVPVRRVEGCDLVDLWPDLCVASEADNVHEKNYMLTVELGGDDKYASAAGGAPFRIAESTYAPVSVLLDLGGSDVYEPASYLGTLPTDEVSDELPMNTLLGSGAGIYGGVGILADASGDDTHRVHVASGPGDFAPNDIVTAYTQGSGRLGIGVLADERGSDVYSTTAASGPGIVNLVAQGAAFGPCWAGRYESAEQSFSEIGCDSGMFGALIDRDSGADRYTLDAGVAEGPIAKEKTGTRQWLVTPMRLVTGQASGLLASALLLDGGGADSFVLAAGATGPSHVGEARAKPFAIAMGQGFSWDGTGRLLTGAGDTSYQAVLNATGAVAWSFLQAQGAGFFSGGTGLLHDAGGNDRYEIANTVTTRFSAGGSGCCRQKFTFFEPIMTTTGQGAGISGNGGLIDSDGDDAYSFIDEIDAEFKLAGETYDAAAMEVQMSSHDPTGQGGGLGGEGYLLDAAGRDSYTFSASTRLRAAAEAATNQQHSSRPVPVVLANSALPAAVAQGGGTSLGGGALVDLGGNGDRFDARSRIDARTAPDPGGMFMPGFTVAFHGRGHGPESPGTFVVHGTNASIFSSPNEPIACLGADGTRPDGNLGAQLGVGCDPHSTGFSAITYPGSNMASPRIRVTAEPARWDLTFRHLPSTRRTRVSATVLSREGEPIAGRAVHFYLVEETYSGDTRGGVDVPIRRRYETGITNDQGVATAMLPMDYPSDHGEPGTPGVMAIFDGIPRPEDAPTGAPGVPAVYGYTRVEAP